MSRLTAIVAGLIGLAATSARADAPAPGAVTNPNAPEDITEQGVAAAIGVAGGASNTAGGLRVTGHYYYQLTDTDWFDGTASFTLGGGAAGCFRDRANEIVCDHGIASGSGADIGVSVRRFLAGNGQFWPFVRVGVGLGIVRYSDDELTGLTIPLKAGGGFRVSVAPGIAILAEATLDVGIGFFTRDLGIEPQLGGAVTAGAEFAL